MKIFTIKKHTMCVLLVGVILICSIVGVCYAVNATTSPKALYTIVIDAGHGGVDVKLGQYILIEKRHIFYKCKKSISVDMLNFLFYK